MEFAELLQDAAEAGPACTDVRVLLATRTDADGHRYPGERTWVDDIGAVVVDDADDVVHLVPLRLLADDAAALTIADFADQLAQEPRIAGFALFARTFAAADDGVRVEASTPIIGSWFREVDGTPTLWLLLHPIEQWT